MKRLHRIQSALDNTMSDDEVLIDLSNLCDDIDKLRDDLNTLSSQYRAASRSEAAEIVDDVVSALESAKLSVIRRVRAHFDSDDYKKYDF